MIQGKESRVDSIEITLPSFVAERRRPGTKGQKGIVCKHHRGGSEISESRLPGVLICS